MTADRAPAAADAFWKNGWRVSVVLACLAAVAFVTLAWATAGEKRDLPGLALAAIHFIVVWTATAWLFRWGCIADASVRQRIVCRHFVSLAVLDTALRWRSATEPSVASQTFARGGGRPRRFGRSLRSRFGSPAFDRRDGPSAQRQLPLENARAASYAGMVNKFHRQYALDPVLSAGALGPQRIWFTPSAVETPPSEDAFRLFAAAAKRRGRPCLAVAGRKEYP